MPRDQARAKCSSRAVNSINSVNSNKGTVDFSSVSRPSSTSSDALTAHGSNERLVLWPCSVVEHPNSKSEFFTPINEPSVFPSFPETVFDFHLFMDLSEVKSIITFNEVF